MIKSNRKVVVAMSGGVDSSVVAALLHNQGDTVIGVTMRLYDDNNSEEKKTKACCAGRDICDAQAVAYQLGIPHYVIDYKSVFKKEVIDDFVNSYLNGETPLPCVRCNQSVKFNDLFKVAKDLGADSLATGHYIRKENFDNEICMYKGKDFTKDQSYFLFATTKDQLSYLEFPLGNYDKSYTRKYARQNDLKVFDKPDSQDICFVSTDYRDVVRKFTPEGVSKGKILHIDGYELGEHNGILNYTIGQRKGLGITSSDPLYVINISRDDNIIYVGPEKSLLKKNFVIKDTNWLVDKDYFADKKVSVKVRHKSAEIMANIQIINDNEAEVFLFDYHRAITPGQACVVYAQDRVLGGGWITQKIW